MHGDPGTWNLLLTPDSRLGILDWEAAEPDGLPLWDLFHLLRSYATLASSSWLPHRSLRLARRQLVDGSTLTATFAASVAAYRDALGLPAEIVEPLYHLGWVHRAVKEASRLAPDRLPSGHYVRLLRSGMSGHVTAGLDLLVGGRERDAG
jgi:aminoglycoside phosphotransferase (APT) family kinase protein